MLQARTIRWYIAQYFKSWRRDVYKDAGKWQISRGSSGGCPVVETQHHSNQTAGLGRDLDNACSHLLSSKLNTPSRSLSCWSHPVLASAVCNQEPWERIRQFQVCVNKVIPGMKSRGNRASLIGRRQEAPTDYDKLGQRKLTHEVELGSPVPLWCFYSWTPETMFGGKGNIVKLTISSHIYFYLNPNWMVVYWVYSFFFFFNFNRFYVKPKL